VEVETLATEIQSGVQHRNRASSAIAPSDKPEPVTGEALLHGIAYHFGVVATGGNPRQRFSLVFALFADSPFAADCHWLRLLRSINAPSARRGSLIAKGAFWDHVNPCTSA
jgi:hypothetical protein